MILQLEGGLFKIQWYICVYPYVAFDKNPAIFSDPSGADSVYNSNTGKYVINGNEVSFEDALSYVNSGVIVMVKIIMKLIREKKKSKTKR